MGGGGSGQGGGGQGGWERRIEAFVKIQKKKIFGVGGGGGQVGGQGGCERRSKVFVKIQKKNIFFWGGGVGRGGGGVRSGVEVGEVRGSKFWVSWYMLGMGDVNQE